MWPRLRSDAKLFHRVVSLKRALDLAGSVLRAADLTGFCPSPGACCSREILAETPLPCEQADHFIYVLALKDPAVSQFVLLEDSLPRCKASKVRYPIAGTTKPFSFLNTRQQH